MLLLALLCAVVSLVLPLNVLIWNPTVGHSHVRFLSNIADILINDGHNVTIVSPLVDPDVSVNGLHPAVLHLPYQSKYTRNIEDNDFAKLDIKGTSLWDVPPKEGRSTSVQDIALFMTTLKNVYRGLLEDKEFLSRLLDSRFDVALHEIYDCYPVAIFELIGVTKTVAVSAFGMTPYAYEITGIPANPSYVPGVYSTYSDDMTFWERLNNFKFETEMDIRNRYWERELWSHFDEVYPGFPDFRYLLKQKVGAVLLNVHEFTETPRPMVNMVRYIGGLTVHAAKPLDEKLDAILNKRSTNVLLSFGSLSQAKDMPLFLKKDIVNAFAAFPNTTFIWKYEEENDSHLFEDHPNIHIMKWVPQRDLLGDKRLSAFITHAGMNSVLEATFAGKPMITVPLFGDQYLNAKNVERRGLALLIDRSSLNKDTLIAGLAEVLLPNASYARRAATVARYLNGRPAAARAEVSHWVKLIAEEGQMDHLMMKARDLSFVQYHCLDIIAYLLLQFVVIMYIAFLILKLIIRQIGVIFQKRKVD